MGDISGVHETLCQGRVCVKAIVTAAFFLPVTPWEKGFPFTHLSHAENTVLMMNTERYTQASQTMTLQGNKGFMQSHNVINIFSFLNEIILSSQQLTFLPVRHKIVFSSNGICRVGVFLSITPQFGISVERKQIDKKKNSVSLLKILFQFCPFGRPFSLFL